MPGTEAGAGGVDVRATCSTGEVLSLTDVVFGDVHLCGGQSNMQFTLAQIGQQDGFDAAAEIARADGYPHIRTTTVGRTVASYQPLPELEAAPVLPWSAASSKTVGQGNWTAVRIPAHPLYWLFPTLLPSLETWGARECPTRHDRPPAVAHTSGCSHLKAAFERRASSVALGSLPSPQKSIIRVEYPPDYE